MFVFFEKLVISEFGKLIELEQKYKKSINEPELNTEQIRRLRLAVQNDEIKFFVGEVNSKIIAICSLSIIFSTFLCQHIAIFEDFYIEKDFRHKGVASNLVNYVFDTMKSENVTSVWVGCADIDVDMYKSLGFTISLGNLLTCDTSI